MAEYVFAYGEVFEEEMVAVIKVREIANAIDSQHREGQWTIRIQIAKAQELPCALHFNELRELRANAKAYKRQRTRQRQRQKGTKDEAKDAKDDEGMEEDESNVAELRRRLEMMKEAAAETMAAAAKTAAAKQGGSSSGATG